MAQELPWALLCARESDVVFTSELPAGRAEVLRYSGSADAVGRH
jgi:hypothetical protein